MRVISEEIYGENIFRVLEVQTSQVLIQSRFGRSEVRNCSKSVVAVQMVKIVYTFVPRYRDLLPAAVEIPAPERTTIRDAFPLLIYEPTAAKVVSSSVTGSLRSIIVSS